MTAVDLVSIVIPCHDAAEFVGEAVDSALAQTHPLVEVIVVDDASADGSREVVRRYGDAVRAIHLPENRGGAHARNRGAEDAGGAWLLFLDADDRLSADAVAALVDAARAVPGALAACGWRHLVRDGDRWIARHPRVRRAAGGDDPLRAWLEGGFVPTCSLLWPRALFEATGGWDESLTMNDDGDLAMRALAAGARIAHADQGEGFYRRHGAARVTVSTDVRSGAKLRSAMRVLEKLSVALAAEGRLADYRAPIGAAFREIALYAFRAGLAELGRECLAAAGDGAGRGTGARTLAGRLLTRVLGLETKERIAALLARRWFSLKLIG